MNVLSLRSVSTYPCTCACCGQNSPATITAYDDSTRSLATYCSRCFYSLTAIFSIEQ